MNPRANDDAFQGDAPEDYSPPVNNSAKSHKRGSKGNVKQQFQRWYARNRTKRNAYMKRYMAALRSRPLLTDE